MSYSMKHLDSCLVGNASALLDGHKHRWSGWPGAFCLVCGIDDPDEWCIGTVCECPCHEEFWKGYESAMRKEHDATG